MKSEAHIKWMSLLLWCGALVSNLNANPLENPIEFHAHNLKCGSQNNINAIQNEMEDKEKLSKLNALFIKNFMAQDTVAHNQIIHNDFVCIENNGKVVNRKEYMKAWATDYQEGKFTSFSITDETIRIFGSVALVRSKTVYTRIQDGKEVSGNSIYTDTYIKVDGRWWCVQAQITPIATK